MYKVYILRVRLRIRLSLIMNILRSRGVNWLMSINISHSWWINYLRVWLINISVSKRNGSSQNILGQIVSKRRIIQKISVVIVWIVNKVTSISINISVVANLVSSSIVIELVSNLVQLLVSNELAHTIQVLSVSGNLVLLVLSD